MALAKVVCVEGNIASGKSTFLRFFRQLAKVKKLSVEVIEEPVDKWRCLQGLTGQHNLLEAHYKDPKRWSFAFQSYVQLTMMQMHECKVSTSVKMMERSLHSARHCFVENLKERHFLTDAEYEILVRYYEWMRATRSVKPDMIIYLQTTPELVKERILARGRPEEANIKVDYLKRLHELHEMWLEKESFHVIRVPPNECFAPIDEHYEKWCSEIIRAVKPPVLFQIDDHVQVNS
jgi:deoxyadenosine/deoxycytidine kinase